MANDLVISYDLYNPGQDYEKVIEAIKSLGSWAQIHKSVWYVKSTFTADIATEKVWATMDKNDSLFIVDATNKNAASENLKKEVEGYILKHWGR